MRPPSAAKARPAYKPGTLCAAASLIMNGRIDGASRNISLRSIRRSAGGRAPRCSVRCRHARGLEPAKPQCRMSGPIHRMSETSNIPGRPSEARDDPLSKRIGHCHEYDRYGLRQPLQRQQRAAWASEDDIRLHLHNLFGMGRDKFKAVGTPSELSPDIPSFNPAVRGRSERWRSGLLILNSPRLRLGCLLDARLAAVGRAVLADTSLRRQ
jgi:hypothetical protein